MLFIDVAFIRSGIDSHPKDLRAHGSQRWNNL